MFLKRTGRGKVAAQFHTARFRLVPAPALRKPGTAWVELPRPAADTQTSGHASTVRQSLQAQLDSLREDLHPRHAAPRT
ncbi:hypothetical protein ACFYUK_42510 [Nonomuraea wenchangensis]